MPVMRSEVYRRELGTRDELLGHIVGVIARVKVCTVALRRATRSVLTLLQSARMLMVEFFENTGLFEMVVGVSTIWHTQYT
jgi:hypothetical protein